MKVESDNLIQQSRSTNLPQLFHPAVTVVVTVTVDCPDSSVTGITVSGAGVWLGAAVPNAALDDSPNPPPPPCECLG